MTRLRVPLLILYVLLIFFVSSRPNLQPPGPSFLMKDKVAHFGEYFLLGVLLFGGIGWTVSRDKAITFIFLVAVGVSVAALDEMFQGYIPGRKADILDWVADAIGVTCAISILVFTGIGKRRRVPVQSEGGSA